MATKADMCDGTFRTVDVRPRVKQSLHDCLGMKRGAWKRFKRARNAVDAYCDHKAYVLSVVMMLDHAESEARVRWLEACDRIGAKLSQLGSKP